VKIYVNKLVYGKGKTSKTEEPEEMTEAANTAVSVSLLHRE
jgi:hypothetical protein